MRLYPIAALIAAPSVALSLSLGGVSNPSGRYTALLPATAALPNPHRTPGAIDPRVTQANIQQTICVRGYTRRVRPSVHYTERLKRRQVAEYGYHDRRLRDYEEDHLVSLELGGSPTDPRNLWPEPHHVAGGWGAYVKDHLENRLHSLVCHHRISLAEAQHMEAADWIGAYKRFIGPTPHGHRRHRTGG